MTRLIILAILPTLALLFFLYYKNKDLKKLLIGLATFAAILTFAVLSNLTRQVVPLLVTHILLVVLSWGALLVYIVKDKYYWWIIFSPVITLGLFFLLEFFAGSGHEATA